MALVLHSGLESTLVSTKARMRSAGTSLGRTNVVSLAYSGSQTLVFCWPEERVFIHKFILKLYMDTHKQTNKHA